jgi:hypothetical protein
MSWTGSSIHRDDAGGRQDAMPATAQDADGEIGARAYSAVHVMIFFRSPLAALHFFRESEDIFGVSKICNQIQHFSIQELMLVTHWCRGQWYNIRLFSFLRLFPFLILRIPQSRPGLICNSNCVLHLYHPLG